MVRGRGNFESGARQMFRESKMCSQTIHYATKGEITGMIAHVMVILSNQVAPCSLENAVTTSFGALLNTSKTSCNRYVDLST